jgi:Guanylate kinase
VQAVRDVQASGRRPLLDIDSQVYLLSLSPNAQCSKILISMNCDSRAKKGVKLVKENQPELNPIYVFISPPSLSSLRSRLVGRATETEDSLATRLAASEAEIEYARQPGAYDVIIVNDDVERAYRVLRDVALDNRLDVGDRLPDLNA